MGITVERPGGEITFKRLRGITVGATGEVTTMKAQTAVSWRSLMTTMTVAMVVMVVIDQFEEVDS